MDDLARVREHENVVVPVRVDPEVLAENGLFAQLASDHSPDVQIVVDPAGNVRYAGGRVEELVGLSPQEALTASIWEFVHPDDFESAAGAFNEVSRIMGHHMPTAFRVQGPGGVWIDAEIKATTFDGPGGTWLILSVRNMGERDEVIERRHSIEALIREASTVCSGVSWVDLDKTVSSLIARLVAIVEATSFSMGWEIDGEMRVGAFWPSCMPAAVGSSFEQLWPREVLSSSLLHISLTMDDIPRSLLRDRMIIDGVRAAVEIPLSDEAPWGVARFGFRTSAAKWDDANADLVKVLVITLMSTIRRCTVERTLQTQATTDPLTGLMNRSELYRTLDACLTDRRGSGQVAVLYGDLDNFKMVNDLHGHSSGDQLLLAVAEALRSSVRAVDVIARLGGDEFVVICPDVEDSEQLLHIRDRIIESMAKIDTHGVPVRMSLGVVLAEAQESSSDLLNRADREMYKIKRSSGPRRLAQAVVG